MGEACAPEDLAGRKVAWLVWGLPNLLIFTGIFWSAGHVWLWTLALLVAGGACIVNAARCGRRHCHFTGPLYLLGAAATLLDGLRLLSIYWV